MYSKGIALSVILTICYLMVGSASAGQKAFLHTSGTTIVDGEGRPVILRGVGLGGWMVQEGYMLQLQGLGPQNRIRAKLEELLDRNDVENFHRTWLDNAMTKADVDRIAAMGFNSIRVPLHHDLFLDGSGRVRSDGFFLLDRLIGWARANNLYVILDLHAAPGGQGNDLSISDRDPAQPSLWESPENIQSAVNLWSLLARRYRNETAVGAYDLLNEPNWAFEADGDSHGCTEQGNVPLRSFMTNVTAAIRRVDRRHMIVVEGNCWGSNYAGMLPLADPNTVLSFHKYGSANDDASIAPMLALRDRYQMPLWMGETGENSNDWYRAVIELVENNHIGWSFWPWKKMGTSSPVEVVPSAGWTALAAWMNGKGPPPPRAEARETLMRLATHDVRIEFAREHPEVLEALMPASMVVLP